MSRRELTLSSPIVLTLQHMESNRPMTMNPLGGSLLLTSREAPSPVR